LGALESFKCDTGFANILKLVVLGGSYC